MSTPFRVSLPLRFGHCDPAGIAYYPRYFELCDAAIEDWTQKALGVSRGTLHLELGLALPTVDLHATFSAPSRLGDLLDIDIAVRRIGRSSLVLAVEVTSGGSERFLVSFTQVLTDMNTMTSQPWPRVWRERLMTLLEKETTA